MNMYVKKGLNYAGKKTFKKRSNTFGNSKNLLFKTLGMFGGLPMLVIIIYTFWKWSDILDWLNNNVFHRNTNYYKGSVSELPNDKDYYIQKATDLHEIIYSAFGSPLDIELSNVIASFEGNELLYIMDLYNRSHQNTLISDIQNEFSVWSNLNPIQPYVTTRIIQAFEKVGLKITL